ncbi:uncharacterized protein BO80DRAFT_436018 [Aspergillus ibericus CBS 121593]|uniref:GST C-terminal domain-containing protein n=1 Tax=Aspergillus ibericus CBS 121593 TaxID=1448316 RepID=A0A395GVL9_9EURO|nr:hypothetical protein BO80DRAFT_436018 [Aspergillus ibericus CBS 121593]RAK99432.1 hypothetical protein BO80DRAFT_436018 [Aspergillus ibericus CBS 121593]
MSNPPSVISLGNHHPLPPLPSDSPANRNPYTHPDSPSSSSSPIYSPISPTTPPSYLHYHHHPQTPQYLIPLPPPFHPLPSPSPPPLPTIYILDGDTALALSIRHFILERGGVRIRSGFLPVQQTPHLDPSVVVSDPETDYEGHIPVLFLDSPTVYPVRKIVGFGPISEYVDAVAVGGRRLYGEGEGERAVVRALVGVLGREVVRPLYEWNNVVYGGVGGVMEEEEEEELMGRVVRGLEWVEEKLEEREMEWEEEGRIGRRGREVEETGYLLGRFSAADVYFFGLVVAHVGRWEWIFDAHRRPRVTEYFARVRQRPMTELAGEFWDTEVATVVEPGERWGYI